MLITMKKNTLIKIFKKLHCKSDEKYKGIFIKPTYCGGLTLVNMCSKHSARITIPRHFAILKEEIENSLEKKYDYINDLEFEKQYLFFKRKDIDNFLLLNKVGKVKEECNIVISYEELSITIYSNSIQPFTFYYTEDDILYSKGLKNSCMDFNFFNARKLGEHGIIDEQILYKSLVLEGIKGKYTIDSIGCLDLEISIPIKSYKYAIKNFSTKNVVTVLTDSLDFDNWFLVVRSIDEEIGELSVGILKDYKKNK